MAQVKFRWNKNQETEEIREEIPNIWCPFCGKQIIKDKYPIPNDSTHDIFEDSFVCKKHDSILAHIIWERIQKPTASLKP